MIGDFKDAVFTYMGRGQSMIKLNANITIKLHALNMQHFSLKAFKAFLDYAV